MVKIRKNREHFLSFIYNNDQDAEKLQNLPKK